MSAPPPSLADLIANLQASLTAPTQAAAALPEASDLVFERTLSRKFGKALDVEAERILLLVQQVLQFGNPSARSIDGDLIKDGVYGNVVEGVEGFLEGADEGIEKFMGLKKVNTALGAKGEDFVATLRGKKLEEGAKPPLPSNLLHDSSLAKPQLLFTVRLTLPRALLPINPNDNFDAMVWKPVLREKVNASNDMEDWRQTEVVEPTDQDSYEIKRTRSCHPYTTELSTLSPTDEYFIEPTTPLAAPSDSFEVTPFKFVSTLSDFTEMLNDIRAVGAECVTKGDGKGKELAVDLEHHDYRSWGGMTCLIQLSTRRKDYVIDALDPIIRDSLEGLNEFFTDPSWVKVFHGAQSDIVWLQRDFGLYIVGLFDTYHATKILEYSQHSLASLLAMYAGFAADKRYQLADWRIRPIPKEMLHYARSDTHYLLAVYDHLRIALHNRALNPPPPVEGAAIIAPPTARDLLQEVYRRSIRTSSIVFELPNCSFETGLGDQGWRILLRKFRHEKEYLTALAVPTLPIKTSWGPSEISLELARGLHYWRERVAREIDESWKFVLNNNALLALVEHNPKDEVEMMRVLGNVKGGAGEIVRGRKEEMMAVLKESLARVTVGPTSKSFISEFSSGLVGNENRGEASLEPAVRPVEGLWDIKVVEAKIGNILSAVSSLFGKKVVVAPIQTSLVASTSSFLGKRTNVGGNVAEERVKKIHDSLVLGGGLASSIRSRNIPAAIPVVPILKPVIAPAPAREPDALSNDHSYVPFSDRQPKEEPVVASTSKLNTDILVVSSMPDKPKKRRRAKVEDSTTNEVESTPLEDEPTPPKRSKVKKPKPKLPKEVLEPHDYSTNNSILDTEPEGKKTFAGGKAQKKKDKATKMEGFAVDTGEFRKTPRVNNAPKRGNKAMSFSK